MEAVLSASIHPCKITEYSSDALVDEGDIDWSGVYSEGWSAAEGFRWQGDVQAPGFACVLNPELNFALGNNLKTGDERPFIITDVSSGRYSFVIILAKSMGESPELVYADDGTLLAIEITAEYGVDIGIITTTGE